MNKKNWYYRQIVTDSDLSTAFTGAEELINNTVLDHGLCNIPGTDYAGGIVTGLSVDISEIAQTITVNTGICYDYLGKRIEIEAAKVISVSNLLEDGSSDVGTTTFDSGTLIYGTIISANKMAAVGLAVDYGTLESDPVIDGFGNSINSTYSDSFSFYLKCGTPCADTTALEDLPLPAISNSIILQDLVLWNNGTQLLVTIPSEVYYPTWKIARVKGFYNYTIGGFSIQASTPREGLKNIQNALNDHATNISNKHAASGVTVTSRSTNWDTTSGLISNSSTNVQDAVWHAIDGVNARIPLAGATNIAGNLVPTNDGTQALGSSSKYWDVYANDLNISGDTLPKTNGNLDLGNTDHRFAEGWINTIYNTDAYLSNIDVNTTDSEYSNSKQLIIKAPYTNSPGLKISIDDPDTGSTGATPRINIYPRGYGIAEQISDGFQIGANNVGIKTTRTYAASTADRSLIIGNFGGNTPSISITDGPSYAAASRTCTFDFYPDTSTYKPALLALSAPRRDTLAFPLQSVVAYDTEGGSGWEYLPVSIDVPNPETDVPAGVWHYYGAPPTGASPNNNYDSIYFELCGLPAHAVFKKIYVRHYKYGNTGSNLVIGAYIRKMWETSFIEILSPVTFTEPNPSGTWQNEEFLITNVTEFNSANNSVIVKISLPGETPGTVHRYCIACVAIQFQYTTVMPWADNT